MTASGRVPRREAVLPGALAALAVVELALLDAPGRAPAAALLVAACLLLAVRSRWPLPAATASGVLALGVPWVGPELHDVITIALVLVVSCFALARWLPDLRGLAGIAIVLAATALTYAAVDERDHGVDDAVLVVAVALPPYVGGRFARRLADHNELLRHEQELLRRQAVRDERDRLARELHDVVAHAISAMVVQVAAAEDLVARDPGRAVELLGTAAAAGRGALAETGRLLRLLRDTDDELGLAPAPAGGAERTGLVGSEP